MLDEGGDGGLEMTRHVLVLKQDAVLQSLMPALNLLSYGMIGR